LAFCPVCVDLTAVEEGAQEARLVFLKIEGCDPTERIISFIAPVT
jgi:hypothetical protein